MSKQTFSKADGKPDARVTITDPELMTRQKRRQVGLWLRRVAYLLERDHAKMEGKFTATFNG